MSEVLEDGEMLAEAVVVELVDPKSGEVLAAEVQLEIEYKGRLYGLLIPVDPIVKVLSYDPSDDDSELVEMEPDEFAEVADFINGKLAKFKCAIEVHADECILMGEPPESVYDDPETLEVETEAGEQELLILFEVKKKRKIGYLVALPTMPPMWPAELIEDGKACLLDDRDIDDELDAAFKQAVEMMLDDDEDYVD